MPLFPWSSKKAGPAKDEVLESGLTFDQIMKEREEYVQNIGIEYRYGCYEEKRAESCQYLGEYFEALLNFKQAFETFGENCEKRRHPRSCFRYGVYLAGGRECEPSFKKALEPLQIGCDGDIAKSCHYLGLIHWRSEPGRELDSALAEQLMIKACELGDYDSCAVLSEWYLGAEEKFKRDKKVVKTTRDRKTGVLARDMEKALAYGIKACEEGELYNACANVSRMYRLGRDMPKDIDKSKYYFDRAHQIYKRMKKGFDPGFTG